MMFKVYIESLIRDHHKPKGNDAYSIVVENLQTSESEMSFCDPRVKDE